MESWLRKKNNVQLDVFKKALRIADEEILA
jgi:hypothetical protein